MAKFDYETTFTLTNPVKDFDAAFDYLQEYDMTEFLIDDIKVDNKRGRCDIDPSTISNLEWILRTPQSGKIVFDSTVELTPEQLKYISNWVSGQNSDGLGEGFEQQGFAEVYDEPEDEEDELYGEPVDFASFDWQTNDYEFKLKGKTNESVLRESVEKCCENCKWYYMSFSTGVSDCNCPDEFGSEWVRQKEEDIWTVDYDYCDRWEPAPEEPDYPDDFFKESKVSKAVNSILEGRSVQAVLSGLIKEDLDGYSEKHPLMVKCARGDYYLWKDADGEVWGSPQHPRQNVVDARAIKNFTDAGFETLEDALEYVKKYF